MATTLAFVACVRGPALPLRGRSGPANVLLITIDTLRADHLGAWGYPAATSAAIDAVAASGVRFANATTPVPTTAPALASMLTGVHLEGHRVAENLGELPADVFSMAESFAAAGYATAGFYANAAVENGFDQGFSVYRPFLPTDDKGVDAATAWLADAPSPWFLWIHFKDPHGPYRSWPASYSEKLALPWRPQWDWHLPVSRYNSGYGLIPAYQELRGITRVGDYVRRYDGEIVGTDRQVGALLDFLGESGMDSSTLIVLTADHGESLGEDNYYFQHGHQLNEASLHVPLLLRHPDLPAAKTVSTPVSLVDVFPTVAELVGIEGPRAAAGRSLAPDILGVDVHAPPRTLIAYTVPGNHLVSARRGRWKVIGTPTLGDDGPGDFAAFEVRDLTAGRDEPVEPEAIGPVFAELCRAVEEARDRIAPGFGAPVELDRHDQQRLRELGYVD